MDEAQARPHTAWTHSALVQGNAVPDYLKWDYQPTSLEGVPESWMAYLAVDDVDARVKRATAAGAKLMRPLFDVPDVGRIAILKEPGGAGIGWMTPAPR